jgi:hypothetical protein
MTKVTIEINTGLDETITSDAITEARSRAKLAANKIGLLSTIDLTQPLTQPLSQAFWSAVNQTKEEQGNLGYKNNDLSNGKNHLKNSKNCRVIATAGGMPAFTGVNGDNDIPFVSLVGMVPAAINGQCFGGVSLESYRSSYRRNYLVQQPGQNLANIYLLTNNNSPAFHQSETNDWGNANPGTLLVSYVGDGTGTNDDTKFSWDWVGNGGNPAKIPNTATGVIISDDPFFQAKQQVWMPQVNAWLAGNVNRRIVFPNGNYSPSGQYAGQMIVLGYNLVAAYRLLGALASSVSLNPNVNFGFIKLAWP